MPKLEQGLVCFITPTELHKIREKSSFIQSYYPVVKDLELLTKTLVIIATETEAYVQRPNLAEEEDKENVSPPDSANSSILSSDDGIDGSGKPLPLQKFANLSVVANAMVVESPLDHVSVRKTFAFGVAKRLSELNGRQLLTTIYAALKEQSLPSWMSDGLAVIIPFEDQPSPFTSVLTCIQIMANDADKVQFINAKCHKESVSKNQLPDLRELRRVMPRLQKSKEERFCAEYCLGVVNTGDGGSHTTVRFSAEWEEALHLFDYPDDRVKGQLVLRPAFGAKGELPFIFENLSRIKVLHAVLTGPTGNFAADLPGTVSTKKTIANFKSLSVIADVVKTGCLATEADNPSVALECSLLFNPMDPSPRWRKVVARRKRDLTEVLWLVMRDLSTPEAIRHHFQALLNFLLTEKLSCSVDPKNDTALALILRRLSNHGVPQFTNGIELLLEAGFFALHRDLAAVLEAVLHDDQDIWREVQPMLAFYAREGSVTLKERVQRLDRLCRATEFAALLKMQQRDVGRSVRHILNFFKERSSEEMVFNSVPVGSLYLKEVSPASWSVTQCGNPMVKHLFKRSQQDIATSSDPSFAKFTHLEMVVKTVCLR